jgi:ribonuclease HII
MHGGGSPRRLCAGVDEAGRGSVLGPLVVGCFVLPEDEADEVPATGARDSKQLSPSERERVFDALHAVGRCSALFLPPTTIDRYVAREELNLLEAKAFARLWTDSRADVLYADACDTDPARFGRVIRAEAGRRGTVVARHRADETFPIVGAASVVAKVLRDRYITRLCERLGADLGSGYPSDPVTVAFLTALLSAGGPVPQFVRQSWATMERVKPSPKVQRLESFTP